jgi:hypothetical protein
MTNDPRSYLHRTGIMADTTKAQEYAAKVRVKVKAHERGMPAMSTPKPTPASLKVTRVAIGAQTGAKSPSIEGSCTPIPEGPERRVPTNTKSPSTDGNQKPIPTGTNPPVAGKKAPKMASSESATPEQGRVHPKESATYEAAENRAVGHFHSEKVMREGHNTKKSMKLGGGGRFKAIEKKAAASGAKNPAAVAAAAGIAKYGKAKMAKMAAAGRKRAK